MYGVLFVVDGSRCRQILQFDKVVLLLTHVWRCQENHGLYRALVVRIVYSIVVRGTRLATKLRLPSTTPNQWRAPCTVRG